MSWHNLSVTSSDEGKLMHPQTFVGAAEPQSDGEAWHIIHANCMPSDITEGQRSGYEATLRLKVIAGDTLGHVLTVIINERGPIHVKVSPCDDNQRASALAGVLRALRAMDLHDPRPGLDSHVPGLR